MNESDTEIRESHETQVIDAPDLRSASQSGDGLESRLRHFIDETFFLGGDAADLSGDDSLLGRGVIDSTGVLELIAFIEETFQIDVADDDMVPENLDSISCIAGFIRRKTGEHSSECAAGAGS